MRALDELLVSLGLFETTEYFSRTFGSGGWAVAMNIGGGDSMIGMVHRFICLIPDGYRRESVVSLDKGGASSHWNNSGWDVPDSASGAVDAGRRRRR